MKKLLLLFCLLWGYEAYPQSEEDLRLDIHQIRVTEGHATLIVVRTAPPFNQVLSSTLIDAGKSKTEDANLIAEVIKNRADSKLDHVFITHYDLDHYNGLLNSGTTNSGILKRRCDPAEPTASKLTGSTAGSQLQLFRNKMVENTPGSLAEVIQTYATELSDYGWTENMDLNLSPVNGLNDKIKLRTLAVYGNLRDSNLKLDVKNKNSRSGVALITWGDFSFLVQGDLQAGGGAKQKIGRTNTFYRPTISQEPVRIPSNWSGATTQNAIDLAITEPDGIAGIKRKVNTDVTRDNVSVTDIPLSLTDFPYDIAYPNEWHHELGNKIDLFNGSGCYAHACLALIPHHGAPTSNLWFDSKYAIVGSNATNNHGHPVPQAISAAYHTSGISHFFFTYLENKTKGKIAYNRLTELTKWQSDINNDPSLRNVEFYSLGKDEKVLEFEVSINTENNKKQVRVSARTSDSNTTGNRYVLSFFCDHSQLPCNN
ncbi:MBL fold metallo-hydrolase [Fulvivirga sp. 29W222]|uniref:MBL fold metallo-hydrolase n=1 Tax=Fulvivirga marina TaxID=2494733 RepID=A0A937KBM3_9BACT|nr:MBL fold metallo-hydrolase [Fulvivirga marina]MBL6446417.1 MBL fold metallo-hydrolase [Fulvivirga marina]